MMLALHQKNVEKVWTSMENFGMLVIYDIWCEVALGCIELYTLPSMHSSSVPDLAVLILFLLACSSMDIHCLYGRFCNEIS